MKLIIEVNKEDLDFIRKTFAKDAHDYIPMVIRNCFTDAVLNGTPIPDNATVCVEPTFDWLQNRVDLAKAEINNAIESTFCTKDEAIGLGIALNVIDKYFTI